MKRASAMAMAMAASLMLAAVPAHAGWLGLSDGDYAVTLECTLSSQFACPASFQGTLSVAGDDVTLL